MQVILMSCGSPSQVIAYHPGVVEKDNYAGDQFSNQQDQFQLLCFCYLLPSLAASLRAQMT